MHTYAWARSHSVAWKEASLACCQNFALQRQPAVNRIIRICLGAATPPPPPLPSVFSPYSSPPTLTSINPRQLAHNKRCI